MTKRDLLIFLAGGCAGMGGAAFAGIWNQQPYSWLAFLIWAAAAFVSLVIAGRQSS